jgi:hypothetical protein
MFLTCYSVDIRMKALVLSNSCVIRTLENRCFILDLTLLYNRVEIATRILMLRKAPVAFDCVVEINISAVRVVW